MGSRRKHIPGVFIRRRRVGLKNALLSSRGYRVVVVERVDLESSSMVLSFTSRSFSMDILY